VRLGIIKEMTRGETRVALLPDTIKDLIAKGLEIVVEAGAGVAAGATDTAYEEAGATVTQDRAALLSNVDVLPVVNCPAAEDQRLLRAGAIMIGFLRPLDAPKDLLPAINQGATLFSTELVPRITRAQAMDALSSMATIAGYKAAVLAADMLPRLFPLMIMAAGTIPPAKVFVIGAGVAGLQAIATARRLGAVVEAYDVRPAAGEQVRSLGAKFLEIDLAGIETEDTRGYAMELTEEALNLGRDLITKTAGYSDLIITTALIPGRPAPLLIRKEAVEAMRPGSLIIDLAAPAGGNCEWTQPGETTNINGVTIVAPLNLAATVPVHASQLYSRNIGNFLQLILRSGNISVDLDDEILSGSCVAHQGRIVNSRVVEILELAARA
jgi:H+-translocating NAD(P) transhydrogenase subunit alpha